MYKYFVSYNHMHLGTIGFGHGEINRDKKITNIDSVREVSEEIEKEFGYPKGSVIVINFQLFEKEESKNNERKNVKDLGNHRLLELFAQKAIDYHESGNHQDYSESIQYGFEIKERMRKKKEDRN